MPDDRAPAPALTYLGDGVYARHDSFQVWIHTSDGICRSPEIAINQDTMSSLARYWRRLGWSP